MSVDPLNKAPRIAIGNGQKKPSGKDKAEIVSDGGEDRIGGVVNATFKVAASEPTFGLEVIARAGWRSVVVARVWWRGRCLAVDLR
jgi:hypothetical protein